MHTHVHTSICSSIRINIISSIASSITIITIHICILCIHARVYMCRYIHIYIYIYIHRCTNHTVRFRSVRFVCILTCIKLSYTCNILRCPCIRLTILCMLSLVCLIHHYTTYYTKFAMQIQTHSCRYKRTHAHGVWL